MNTTYRFAMTVTRVTEYETDVPFDTDDDDAASLYAQELTPDDMTEVDDTTIDMAVSYEKIDTPPAPAAGPVIEFPQSDGLISVLLYANKGLAANGYTRDGDGLTYDFHLDDGTVVTGTFYSEGWTDEQIVTIATHRNGSPDGGRVDVALRDITRIVYC